MTAIIFCGPTLDRDAAGALLPNAIVLGPAACGDVYRASRRNPDAIGLIDGYFDHRLSVWHKEILWALSRGQRVYGAASMGALRAAELESLGMIGVGRIFEQYASGELEDDDEVAVVHESEGDGYRARSEALVNVRATLERAVRDAAISESASASLVAFAKTQFYAERSYSALLHAASRLGISSADASGLSAFLEHPGPIQQKRLDATSMLERMREDSLRPPSKALVDFRFAYTNAWHVFREKIDAESAPEQAAPTVEVAAANEETLWLDRLQRCDRTLAATLWAEALERALALLLADEQAADPDAAAMESEAEAFRRARGLLSAEQVETWMKENDLDVASLSTLIYDEVSIRRFRDAARRLGMRQIPNALRSTSAYTRLKIE